MNVLILGVGGQDGSYLAEILLRRGYEVFGLHRRTSTGNLERLAGLKDKITLVRGDMLDPSSLVSAIESVDPHVIYNVADQDHVGWSIASPLYSAKVTTDAPIFIMDYLFQSGRNTKLFQPCSATMFAGDKENVPQRETSPIYPMSPYAVAKTATYHWANYYRSRGVPVYTGIMFNHDSPRRKGEYLLQKIMKGAKIASTYKHRPGTLMLGNLNLRVDIGYAKDYMEGVVDMMEQADPDNYVLGTGVGYKVGELADEALTLLGLSSDNLEEVPGFEDEPTLIAASGKAHEAFDWSPKHDAMSLLRAMVKGETL